MSAHSLRGQCDTPAGRKGTGGGPGDSSGWTLSWTETSILAVTSCLPPPPHTLEDGPIGKHSQVRSFVRNHEECGLLVIPDEGVWCPDSPLAWHLHHLDVSSSVLQSRVTPPLPGSLSGSESNVTWRYLRVMSVLNSISLVSTGPRALRYMLTSTKLAPFLVKKGLPSAEGLWPGS